MSSEIITSDKVIGHVDDHFEDVSNALELHHRRLGHLSLREVRSQPEFKRADIESGSYDAIPATILTSEYAHEDQVVVFMPMSEPYDSVYSRLLAKQLQTASQGSTVTTLFPNLQNRKAEGTHKTVVDSEYGRRVTKDHLAPGDRLEKMFYDASKKGSDKGLKKYDESKFGATDQDQDTLGPLKRYAAPYTNAIINMFDNDRTDQPELYNPAVIHMIGVQSGATVASEVARQLTSLRLDTEDEVDLYFSTPEIESLLLVEPINIGDGGQQQRSPSVIRNVTSPTDNLRKKIKFLEGYGPDALEEYYKRMQTGYGLFSKLRPPGKNANYAHTTLLYEYDGGELLQAMCQNSLGQQLSNLPDKVFNVIYRGQDSPVSPPIDRAYLEKNVSAQVRLVENRELDGESYLDILEIAKLAVYTFSQGRKDSSR